MNKGKVARLAGFVGALGLSTVLVTTAVQGTGAWFTDSSSGTITGGSGHLTLLTRAVDDHAGAYVADRTLNLKYENLMPGTNQNREVDYKFDASSGQVDLWLVFTGSDAQYNLFTGGLNHSGNTGVDSSGTGGGLGRYGYFQVKDSTGGGAFASGNLSFPYADSNGGVFNDPTASGNCTTTADGRAWQPQIYQAGPPAVLPGWCGVPKKILVRAGANSGDTGTVTVTFGLNGDKQDQQNQNEFPTGLPYELVATQAGHRP